MSRTLASKTITTLVTTSGSAAVLATVRRGWIDAADGAVLVVSLGVLTRRAIRLAADPASRLRRR